MSSEHYQPAAGGLCLFANERVGASGLDVHRDSLARFVKILGNSLRKHLLGALGSDLMVPVAKLIIRTRRSELRIVEWRQGVYDVQRAIGQGRSGEAKRSNTCCGEVDANERRVIVDRSLVSYDQQWTGGFGKELMGRAANISVASPVFTIRTHNQQLSIGLFDSSA